MQRTLQVTCPGCQRTLKVNCGEQQLLQVTCPQCAKKFAAKVSPAPAPPEDLFAALDPSLLAPAPPAQRVPAQHTRRSAPVVPTFSHPTQAPQRYAPTRPRKQTLPWKGPAAIAASLLVLIPAGWLVFKAARTVKEEGLGGLTSISLLPDSHDKVQAEFLAMRERTLKQFLDAGTIDQAYVEQLRENTPRGQRFAERLLVRAIKLGPAPREQREAYRERVTGLMETYNERMMERLKSLTPQEQELLSGVAPKGARTAEMIAEMAAASYLTEGMYELQPPDSDKERIYFDESNLVHDYLQVLAEVDSARDISEAAERIESLADDMLGVAIRRAQLPGQFDFVNRTYLDVENSFKIAEPVLLNRVERDIGEARQLDHAVANFKTARGLIDDAAAGSSPSQLRKAMDEARSAQRGVSPTPPKYDATPTVPADSFATDPQRPAAPAPQAAPKSIADSAETATPYEDTSSSDVAGSPAGETPDDAVAGPQPTRGPPRGFAGSRFGPGRFAGPRRGNGSAMSSGPNGPARMSPGEQLKRFDGPDSVKVMVNTSQDAKAFSDRLVKQLDVRDYYLRMNNDTTMIAMRFSGSLEEVTEAIDFGAVTKEDAEARVIHIDASETPSP